MGLANTKEKLFDVRTAQRYLQNGTTTEADYKKYLGELKDCEGEFAVVPAEVILGTEPYNPNRRRRIAGRSDKREWDYSALRFEEDLEDDEMEEIGGYGSEEDELPTRSYEDLDD